MEIKEERPLNKKAIFAFLLASCIVAAFFAYLYIRSKSKVRSRLSCKREYSVQPLAHL